MREDHTGIEIEQRHAGAAYFAREVAVRLLAEARAADCQSSVEIIEAALSSLEGLIAEHHGMAAYRRRRRGLAVPSGRFARARRAGAGRVPQGAGARGR